MGVTIKEIAKLAGVSITTVSLIINGKDQSIGAETRERVLKIIEDQNYVPNTIARSMITKQTNTLGLLIPDITNPYFATMARGIEDAAGKSGYRVILCNTDEDLDKEMEYLQLLRKQNVDGVILVAAAVSELAGAGVYESFQRPLVFLDRKGSGAMEAQAHVGFDNRKGAYLAVCHLIEAGHKKIGCITGPMKNRSAQERYQGYLDALAQAGMPVNPQWVVEGDYQMIGGERGIRALKDTGITACMVSNDWMAYGAYKACYEEGIRIPEDLSLVGFDDLTISQVMIPPLTTVHQPNIAMGTAAVQALVEWIRIGKPPKDQVIYEAKLVIRKSVRRMDK
jgi:LacI family transcriptional regulator